MKSILLAAPAALALIAGPAIAEDGSDAALALAADNCAGPLLDAIYAAGNFSGVERGEVAHAKASRSFEAAEEQVKAGCEHAVRHPDARPSKIEPLEPEKNAKDDACSTPLVEKINAAIRAIHDSPHNGRERGKFGKAIRALSRARAAVRRFCRAPKKAPVRKHGKGGDPDDEDTESEAVWPAGGPA